MKRRFGFLVLVLFLALSLAPAAIYGQGISSVVLTAPEVIITSGSQIQLQALARDSQGNPRNNDRFNFTSSNPLVVSVDASGNVTAKNPGIANVTAVVQGTNSSSAGVSLQVIPQRIDVTAPAQEIIVGDSLQFTATALDINGQPIPNVSFRWQLTGANGFTTRAATIDSNGLLTTVGIGLMTIHAQIAYSTQSSAQIPTFEGLTQVTINFRKEYKLTRMVASAPLNRVLSLRPSYNGDPAINESGQAAFTANFDGLGSALMFYDKGRFDMLASAGTPGPLGGYIWHFEGPPAINGQGDVLVRVGTSSSWGLMRASKSSGLNFFLENGIAEGFGRLSYFRVGRYSINDQGDMVLLADFQYTGTSVWHTGLFLLNDQSFRYLWANQDPLPAFPSDFTFDNSMFGVDNQGVVYFRVFSGRNSAIFRIDGTSQPRKIAGTGSTINGLQVQDVQSVVLSPNGAIAFNMTGSGGDVGIVRLRRGASTFEYLPMRQIGSVLSVNDLGYTLYHGDQGGNLSWGFYNWQSTPTPTQLLANDTPLEGGERPNWGRTGKINARGEAYVSMDSPQNHLLVARIDGAPHTLWSGGTVLSVTPNLNFLGVVPGAMSGAVDIFGGGGNASILEVGASSVRTIWAPGDHPAQAINGWVLNYASRSPDGDVYLAVSDGIMRIRNGSAQALAVFPVSDRDKVTLRGPSGWFDGNNAFSSNSSGAFVFNSRTDIENRLEFYDRSVFLPIMVQGGPNQTSSPGGGKFAGLAGSSNRQNAVLIDERGRVLVNAFVTGGPSGLFLYESGQWKPSALFGRTSIGGVTVSGCRSIHVAGENFYALLDMANGDAMIALYDGQGWTPLVRRNDVMPDGTGLTFFYSAFAVNRLGDIAFGAYGNGQKIVLRTADGLNHLVYSEMSATDNDDRFPSQTFEFDIRDDGQIYFVGFDFLGRNMVYRADPIR